MNENTFRIKESVLWAMANSDPEFEGYYNGHKDQFHVKGDLPDNFSEKVLKILSEERENAQLVEKYEKNLSQMKQYSISGLPAISIIIAAAFLLRLHIRVHRSEEGKWEFLMEYKAPDNHLIKDIIEILKNVMRPDS